MRVPLAQVAGIVQHIGRPFTVEVLRAIDVAKVIGAANIVVFKQNMPVVLVVGGRLEGLAHALQIDARAVVATLAGGVVDDDVIIIVPVAGRAVVIDGREKAVGGASALVLDDDVVVQVIEERLVALGDVAAEGIDAAAVAHTRHKRGDVVVGDLCAAQVVFFAVLPRAAGPAPADGNGRIGGFKDSVMHDARFERAAHRDRTAIAIAEAREVDVIVFDQKPTDVLVIHGGVDTALGAVGDGIKDAQSGCADGFKAAGAHRHVREIAAHQKRVAGQVVEDTVLHSAAAEALHRDCRRMGHAVGVTLPNACLTARIVAVVGVDLVLDTREGDAIEGKLFEVFEGEKVRRGGKREGVVLHLSLGAVVKDAFLFVISVLARGGGRRRVLNLEGAVANVDPPVAVLRFALVELYGHVAHALGVNVNVIEIDMVDVVDLKLPLYAHMQLCAAAVLRAHLQNGLLGDVDAVAVLARQLILHNDIFRAVGTLEGPEGLIKALGGGKGRELAVHVQRADILPGGQTADIVGLTLDRLPARVRDAHKRRDDGADALAAHKTQSALAAEVGGVKRNGLRQGIVAAAKREGDLGVAPLPEKGFRLFDGG